MAGPANRAAGVAAGEDEQAHGNESRKQADGELSGGSNFGVNGENKEERKGIWLEQHASV